MLRNSFKQIALGLVSFGACAMTSAATPADFNGIYLGAEAGYIKSHFTFDQTATSALYTAPVSVGGKMSASDFAWGVFLGYGRSFQDKYYLAGEIQGDLFDADAESRQTITTNLGSRVWNFGVRHGYHVGFDLVPGFFAQPNVLLYGKLGYRGTKLRFDPRPIPDAANAFNPAIVNFTADEREYLHGFNLGLGVNYHLCAMPVALRLEYNYSKYQNMTYSFRGLDQSTVDNAIKSYSHQVMVGATYFVG